MRFNGAVRRSLQEDEAEVVVAKTVKEPMSKPTPSPVNTLSLSEIVGLCLSASIYILILDANQSNSPKRTRELEMPVNLTTHLKVSMADDDVSNVTGPEPFDLNLLRNKPFRGDRAKHLDKASLHLLGERHSGTNWIAEHLKNCFGDDVDVVIGFSDWKHWFQWEEPRFRSAVVVAQFRNVYNWVHSMQTNPYHSPLHFNLDWHEFVSKPWTMPRYREDLPFEGVTSANETDLFCRRSDVFKPYQAIPCVANPGINVDWDDKGQLVKNRHVRAFYELRNDGSGLPYKNILELRADKIRNFLAVENFPNVEAFHHVRYEEMSRNGTERLIRELEHDLNITAKCEPLEGRPKKDLALDAAFFDYLTSKVDWKTEALVGYQAEDQEVVKNEKPSKQPRHGHGRTSDLFHGAERHKPQKPCLNLLGERHSGTTWITAHLKQCFGDDVDVFVGFSDWKHWFQWEEPRYPEAVVVAQFRNVYNWVEAMRTNPYHSPMHFNLEWEEFITKPWTMPRYGEDVVFEGISSANKTDIYCLNADVYRPHQVIPCLANATCFVDFDDRGIVEENRREHAFYELRNDGSGLPYKNILHLRADKIRNFLSIKKFDNVKAFHHVRYEDLTNNGTETLIRMLERDLNVTAKCNPVVGRPKTPRSINSVFFEYLTTNVDWDAEALIGYKA